MMTEDRSYDMVNQHVDKCKKEIHLVADNQYCKESGHESAPYGGGPPASAANPSGAPGTGSASGMSY